MTEQKLYDLISSYNFRLYDLELRLNNARNILRGTDVDSAVHELSKILKELQEIVVALSAKED